MIFKALLFCFLAAAQGAVAGEFWLSKKYVSITAEVRLNGQSNRDYQVAYKKLNTARFSELINSLRHADLERLSNQDRRDEVIAHWQRTQIRFEEFAFKSDEPIVSGQTLRQVFKISARKFEELLNLYGYNPSS